MSFKKIPKKICTKYINVKKRFFPYILRHWKSGFGPLAHIKFIKLCTHLSNNNDKASRNTIVKLKFHYHYFKTKIFHYISWTFETKVTEKHYSYYYFRKNSNRKRMLVFSNKNLSREQEIHVKTSIILLNII